MNQMFENLPWHDAELLKIVVNRNEPGLHDEVRLQVMWAQNNLSTIVFHDCYKLTAEMNFGVIAQESIDYAICIERDEGLIKLREQWNSIGVSIIDLTCYEIRTSSTGSLIRIYAKNFSLE